MGKAVQLGAALACALAAGCAADTSSPPTDDPEAEFSWLDPPGRQDALRVLEEADGAMVAWSCDACVDAKGEPIDWNNVDYDLVCAVDGPSARSRAAEACNQELRVRKDATGKDPGYSCSRCDHCIPLALPCDGRCRYELDTESIGPTWMWKRVDCKY